MTLTEKARAIMILTFIYYLVMGEWPDQMDPDYQRAVENVICS